MAGVPSICNPFPFDHCNAVNLGGFPICNDEIKDITASLLSGVCHNEPHLQSLDGEGCPHLNGEGCPHLNAKVFTANIDNNAQLDICAWNHKSGCIF